MRQDLVDDESIHMMSDNKGTKHNTKEDVHMGPFDIEDNAVDVCFGSFDYNIVNRIEETRSSNSKKKDK